MTTEKAFESWCLLELFGHQRVAGRVTEQSIGGCNFIRVDIPSAGGEAAQTKFYGQGAIYCMTPITEAVAFKLFAKLSPQPVSEWDLPQLPDPGGEEPV